MSVFKDIKILDRSLVTFGRTYKENRELAHDLAVSVMYHTAAHRQLSPKDRSDKLHRFYDILKKADQDAFRQWASALVTWKIQENGKEVTKRWLSGSRDEAGLFAFKIIEGTKVQSDQFAADIDRIDSLPSFFDHEPSSRPPGFFGDTELLKALKNLLKKASDGRKENRISDTVFNIVEIAELQIEKSLQSTGRPLGESQPASIVPPADLSKAQESQAKTARHGGKALEAKEEKVAA